MSLHNGHRERLKDRYITSGGLEGFSDSQVLEMLLFYCYPQGDTNEKAHMMLNEFGALSNLMESSVQEIMRRCNVTKRIAVLITLIPHLSKRYATSKWAKRALIDSVQKAGEYAKTLFIGKVTEHFYIICLDSQRRLLYPSLVGEGSLNDIAIYPRKIVEEALKHQASYAILAHNHPGGALKPSQNDLDSTFVINRALAPLDITVLDHIIVAGEEFYSFSENEQLDTLY